MSPWTEAWIDFRGGCGWILIELAMRAFDTRDRTRAVLAKAILEVYKEETNRLSVRR